MLQFSLFGKLKQRKKNTRLRLGGRAVGEGGGRARLCRGKTGRGEQAQEERRLFPQFPPLLRTLPLSSVLCCPSLFPNALIWLKPSSSGTSTQGASVSSLGFQWSLSSSAARRPSPAQGPPCCGSHLISLFPQMNKICACSSPVRWSFNIPLECHLTF